MQPLINFVPARAAEKKGSQAGSNRQSANTRRFAMPGAEEVDAANENDCPQGSATIALRESSFPTGNASSGNLFAGQTEPGDSSPRATRPTNRMTIPEIARRLEVGRVMVYQMLERGVIPGIRMGRRWIVTRFAYERWERTCGFSSAAATPDPSRSE